MNIRIYSYFVMKISSLNLRHFLLFSFYLCKFFCVMPLKFVKYLDNSFQVSLISGCTSFAVLTINSLHIYDKFCRLRSCQLNLECPESYIGLLDACYSFSLIFVFVFFNTHLLCNLMNEIFTSIKIGKNIQSFLIYNQPVILYTLLIAECLRIMMTKLWEASFIEIMLWIFTLFEKIVAFSVDGFVTLVIFTAKLNLYHLNCQLKEVYNTVDAKKHLQCLLITYIRCLELLKKLSCCFGPIIVVITLFKLLQLFGIVYFTLLSNSSNVNGSDVKHESDLIIPIFCLFCIFSAATSLYNEVLFTEFILSGLLNKKNDCNVQPEVEMFFCLMRYRKRCLNASNLFFIHLTVFIKICSLSFVYVLTMLQIHQINDS